MTTKPRGSAQLLRNSIQDDELGQKYLNEAKIHELDQKLTACRMQIYYAWMMIYVIFTVGSTTAAFEIISNKSIAFKYGVYLKIFVDLLTVLGCVLVFVGFCRKSAGIIEKVILIFKINLGSTIAFYLVAIISGSNKLHLVCIGVFFGGMAFVNILPLVYMKNILKKRDAIYPYSSFVDDPLI